MHVSFKWGDNRLNSLYFITLKIKPPSHYYQKFKTIMNKNYEKFRIADRYHIFQFFSGGSWDQLQICLIKQANITYCTCHYIFLKKDKKHSKEEKERKAK